MKFHKYVAYTKQKIINKFYVFIYKRDNAINIEVQSKVLYQKQVNNTHV